MKQRFAPLLACIAAAAILRGVFLAATRHDPTFSIPDLDEAFYHLWARSLSTGQGDFQGPYFVGPLYPHAVSWLYRWFGPDPFAVRVAQSLLGVAGVALVLSLARRLFGTPAGIAAAVLVTLYGPLLFYENLLLLETVLLSAVLAVLWVLLVPRWPALWRGLGCGLLLGIATLARPTALVLLPVVFVALVRDRADVMHPPFRASGRAAALACVAVLLAVVLPVVARNARLGRVAITTNGGVNFYAGNSPGATGRFHEPPGVQFFRSPMLVAAPPGSSLPPDVARRALTVRAAAGTDEAADSGLWMRRARAWIDSDPGAFMRLQARKMSCVLQAAEGAQIESWSFQRQRLPLLRLFIVDFGWIWPLAALGVWCARREHRRGTWIVAAFALALLLPCIVFFVSARYRLAAVPPLAVLAGHGAATLAGWWQARRLRPAAIALAAVLSLGLASRIGATQDRSFGWEHVQMADRLYALGDLSGAIEAQTRAMQSMPERPEVPMQLALYWSERGAPGDAERAVGLLRETARRAPDRAAVWFNLGVALVRAGHGEEARQAWQRALVADPSFEPARARLRATGAAAPIPAP